jgi:glycosyltransferase involved in cell wall biosynthesis
MTNKIAVNGRCLSRRTTGVERYAHEISKRLTSSRIVQPKNSLGQITGNLWEQTVLPAQIKQNEILWSPANAGPWLVQNQVISIHDASVFDHPEWFRPSFAAWTRLSWKILAKQAKAIITVSNFSRERLKFNLRIPNNKIHVIPNGVGKPYEPQSQKTIEAAKEKYGLVNPYFLFVGTHEPRKNLTKLMEAFGKLNNSNHDLIIAGEKGKVFVDSTKQIPNLTNTKLLSYVPDSDLPALYSGASSVIVPSFYEGFGLTALEAMACGAPVISSNTTALPETTGDAALFVDPYNSNELVDAMKNLMENSSLANTLRELGLQRATLFTWERSAAKTSEVCLKDLQSSELS